MLFPAMSNNTIRNIDARTQVPFKKNVGLTGCVDRSGICVKFDTLGASLADPICYDGENEVGLAVAVGRLFVLFKAVLCLQH